jgi:hypothetical protein
MIDFETLVNLSRGAAVADAACPLCGPARKHASNRTRKVMRIWNEGDDFITYHCERCAASGHAKAKGSQQSAPRPRPVKTEPTLDRSHTARFLWSQRKPIAGSIAEIYLRDCRGYRGPLPATLGFLPARGEHPPAMIAAFGIPSETEPGCLVVDDNAMTGVHLTKLKPDGFGKAGTDKDKIMLGPSKGHPIVLQPVSDLGGLLIAEGIETTLAASASGLGLWAAGAASRLPAVADKMPSYVEAVTIIADTDDSGDGIKFSKQLGQLLRKRGLQVFLETGGRHG